MRTTRRFVQMDLPMLTKPWLRTDIRSYAAARLILAVFLPELSGYRPRARQKFLFSALLVVFSISISTSFLQRQSHTWALLFNALRHFIPSTLFLWKRVYA